MKAKTTPQANSLGEFADKKLEESSQTGKSAGGWADALNGMCMTLGPIANLPPKDIKPADLVPVREHLLDSGLAPSTTRFQADIIRQFLSGLVEHGLNPACVAVFRDGRVATIPRHPIEPALRSHLKVILDGLQSQLELVQLLIWILFSGGLALTDAVLLEMAGLNWNTGLIRRTNYKSGKTAVFMASPPLLELLAERRKRLGPEAVYLFPELIFTKAELHDPNCNRTRLNGDIRQVAFRATEQARKLITGFVISSGLDPNKVNYKSLRAHIISLWASIGVRQATLAGVTGHVSEPYGLYHVPTETEIERLCEITWKYLQAIQNDQPCFLPTSYYDIYEALMAELRKIHDEISKSKAA